MLEVLQWTGAVVCLVAFGLSQGGRLVGALVPVSSVQLCRWLGSVGHGGVDPSVGVRPAGGRLGAGRRLEHLVAGPRAGAAGSSGLVLSTLALAAVDILEPARVMIPSVFRVCCDLVHERRIQ